MKFLNSMFAVRNRQASCAAHRSGSVAAKIERAAPLMRLAPRACRLDAVVVALREERLIALPHKLAHQRTHEVDRGEEAPVGFRHVLARRYGSASQDGLVCNAETVSAH